ncbi:hypothetical protein M4D49_20955 [Cupriavidus pauculus]|nr:hypothetical protein [Cupriavidus pauculus]MCM3607971.1 hypothetical protein [Cupriavidus pauculus]
MTPLRHRLPRRIILLSLASVLAVLTMIAGTRYLPWKLEGAGAAIACMGTMTVLHLWIVRQHLAARVTHKTSELARQNRDLESLYDMAAFLNHANESSALARGFLDRVMQRFGGRRWHGAHVRRTARHAAPGGVDRTFLRFGGARALREHRRVPLRARHAQRRRVHHGPAGRFSIIGRRLSVRTGRIPVDGGVPSRHAARRRRHLHAALPRAT